MTVENSSVREGRSHRTTLVTLALLTLASATATQWVAATHPKSLVPWVGMFALIVAWTFRRPRSVDLFEPFTFLSWIHYAPAFVVGSSLLAFGFLAYPYPTIVADPVASCALTLAYTALAYLALRAGSRWRGARALGTQLGRMLPAPRAERTIPLVAILVLIAIGMTANYGAFRAGIIGFAVPRAPGPLDAAVSYAGLFTTLGHFLFWFRWFAPEQKRLPRIALLVPLLVVLSTMVILGNRGALLMQYLVAALAFRFARGRLSVAQGVVAVMLAFVALGIGMTYGSLFRQLRGGESGSAAAAVKDAAARPAATPVPPPVTPPAPIAKPAASPVTPAPAAQPPPPAATAPPAAIAPPVTIATPVTTAPTVAPAATPTLPPPSLERHLEVAAETANTLIRHPLSAPLARIFAGAGQRLNIVSDASVSIARYPALQSLEPQYGIASIWTMTWSGFVPRVLWPGKPMVSDARAYSSLYFGHNLNSYATTPTVDLIRNFGPRGMPLGMALFGVVLGALGVALMAPTSPGRSERAALLSLILVNISLEGSFGLLLPIMFRDAFIVVLGLALVRLLSAPVPTPSGQGPADRRSLGEGG